MDEIFKKWNSLGLLNSAKNNYHKEQLANLLENQNLLNKTSTNDFFKRLSIPLLIRIYSNFIGFDIASVQTILSPVSKIKYRDKMNKLQDVDIKAGVSQLRSKLYSNTHQDVDIKLVEELSEDILMELNLEVISDICNNVGTTMTHFWKSPQNLADAILIASAQIVKKIGSQANWVIVSTDIADELKKLKDDWVDADNILESNRIVKKIGKLSRKWDIFVDPLMSNNCILLGFKGDEYMSGYIYCPYLGLNPLNGEEYKLVSFKGKKLIDSGYFSKINLENYSIEEPEEYYPPFIEQLEPDFPGAEFLVNDDEEVEESVEKELSYE